MYDHIPTWQVSSYLKRLGQAEMNAVLVQIYAWCIVPLECLGEMTWTTVFFLDDRKPTVYTVTVNEGIIELME